MSKYYLVKENFEFECKYTWCGCPDHDTVRYEAGQSINPLTLRMYLDQEEINNLIENDKIEEVESE
jgi:hypothetical protein